MNVDWAQPIKAMLDRLASEALTQIGTDGMIAMKKNLEGEEGTYTGRLKDSLSFKTSFGTTNVAATVAKEAITGQMESLEDYPPAPDKPYTVNIGTSVPYAKYVNYGSMPYSGSVGSAEEEGSFKERLMEWIRNKLGVQEENIDDAYFTISKKIMDNGTDAIPFLEPAIPDIKQSVRKNMVALSREIGGNMRPFVVTVAPEGTSISGTKEELNRAEAFKNAFSEMNPDWLVR